MLTELLLRTFVRDYKNTSDTHVRTAYGSFAGATGIVCNLILFSSKLLIGLFSRSISIMADAFNNLSDAASSVVALIGFKVSAKPPDEDHPFGHARFEYISGLVVAGLILIVGFQFALQSVKKILNPASVEVTTVTAVTLVIAIVMKIWLCRFYYDMGERIGSGTLTATAKDSRNDILTTSVVLVAAIVERTTGLKIDGFIGLAVACIILYSCVEIVRDTISPLLGENADPELVKHLAAKIKDADPRIMSIHDLMVHDYGPGQRFATVHMEMDARVNVLDTHEVIDRVERMIQKEDNIQLLIHHDPIVTDDPELNHLRRMIRKMLSGVDKDLQIHDFRLTDRDNEHILSFDLVLPDNFAGNPDEIISDIEHLLGREEKSYALDVTVDTQSFNRYL